MTDGKLNSTSDLIRKIESESQKETGKDQVVIKVSAGTCGQARGSLKVVESLEKVAGVAWSCGICRCPACLRLRRVLISWCDCPR